MEFIIEGTVSEVTVNNDKTVEFKIAGTEGYAVNKIGYAKVAHNSRPDKNLP